MNKDNLSLLSVILNGVVAAGCVGKLLWDISQGKPLFLQALCAVIWPVLFAMTLQNYLAENREVTQ
ncbi:MAG: hypothetical protein HFF10_08485 [Angelakisella sp.]|jgi:hypothetical protein|nr:hypothetical protein [Angelakisella sp.]